MCHGQCQSTNILNYLLNHKLKSKDWSDGWKVYMSTYVNYKLYIGLYSSWECLQVLEKAARGRNKLQWNLNNCYIMLHIWPAIFDTFGSKVLILLIPHRSLIDPSYSTSSAARRRGDSSLVVFATHGWAPCNKTETWTRHNSWHDARRNTGHASVYTQRVRFTQLKFQEPPVISQRM